jgi:dienelactone hydrolase
MRTPALAAVGLSLALFAPLKPDEKPAAPAGERGKVRFEPPASEKSIPAFYRLGACEFPYELNSRRELLASNIEICHLTFPSPVKSSSPENNTVHAEYYRPRGPGPFPCVIVLDILAGDERVARLCASTLAQNGIAGLFVSMPYYGQRRPPGSKLRFLSLDIDRTVDAIRQGVLDCRCAVAWMQSRPEIDSRRLGIMGVSLGSMVGALTAEMEPRLGRVAVLLGGGGFVDAYYDDPQAAPFRKMWEAIGGTRAEAAKRLAVLDPLTCAANLKDRKVLMVAARRDQIVRPKMAEALWHASGEQRIYWIDATHYSAVMYIVPGLQQVVEHFGAK